VTGGPTVAGQEDGLGRLRGLLRELGVPAELVLRDGAADDASPSVAALVLREGARPGRAPLGGPWAALEFDREGRFVRVSVGG
jgi:hypothetical protein